MEPIVGVRWHCKDCPQQQSVDFCNNCAQRLVEAIHCTVSWLKHVCFASEVTMNLSIKKKEDLLNFSYFLRI